MKDTHAAGPSSIRSSEPSPGIGFLPKRTIIEAFDKTSYFPAAPEVGFGTGTRPPLMEPTPGPGPGAYPIKTTMGKLPESHIASPCQFTLKGREKFGDPNAKALSKTSANEPGPAAYDITDKFVNGTNPRKSGFPKSIRGKVDDKAALGPGPGSYKPMYSMGKQVLSTKHAAVVPGFPHAPRPSMEIKGNDISSLFIFHIHGGILSKQLISSSSNYITCRSLRCPNLPLPYP